MATNHYQNRTYVTLVESSSDVIGAIVLGHRLKMCKSKYPLLVLVGKGLTEEAIKFLESVATMNDLMIIEPAKLLFPQPRSQQGDEHDPGHIRDTYSVIGVFSLHEQGWQKCAFLAPNTAILKNPDQLLDAQLPSRSWIAANHECVCGPDVDSSVCRDLQIAHCPYRCLDSTDNSGIKMSFHSTSTYHLPNISMFVFEPNETVWQEIVRKLESLRGLMGSEETKSELISPQTFMAEFFRDRWLSLSWKFNALRTIRYYHPRIWSDDEVIVVSYLNVKPWEHRLTDGGIAALLRPDNLAYRLWWMCYNEWKQTLDLHPRRGSWHRDLIIFLECLMPPAPHPASEDMAIRSNKNDLDPLTRSKISEKSPATSSGVPTDVATPTDPIQIQTPAHLFDIVSDESLLVRPSLFQYVAGLALSSVLDADFIPSIQDLNQSISFTAAILMIRKLNRRK